MSQSVSINIIVEYLPCAKHCYKHQNQKQNRQNSPLSWDPGEGVYSLYMFLFYCLSMKSWDIFLSVFWWLIWGIYKCICCRNAQTGLNTHRTPIILVEMPSSWPLRYLLNRSQGHLHSNWSLRSAALYIFNRNHIHLIYLFFQVVFFCVSKAGISPNKCVPLCLQLDHNICEAESLCQMQKVSNWWTLYWMN